MDFLISSHFSSFSSSSSSSSVGRASSLVSRYAILCPASFYVLSLVLVIPGRFSSLPFPSKFNGMRPLSVHSVSLLLIIGYFIESTCVCLFPLSPCPRALLIHYAMLRSLDCVERALLCCTGKELR